MNSDHPELNAPIYFSVTGHRDIPQSLHEPLIKHLTEYFESFVKKYENTNIFLLSALADGGDRIAAKAAFDAKIGVIAVLPMPQDVYEKTFLNGAGSRDEFECLLSKTRNEEHPYVLKPKTDGSDMDEQEQYRALGRFFVSHSHILIALWDGKPPKTNGGTSDVVTMARLGVDWGCDSCCDRIEKNLSINSLDIVDNCLTYHIEVPRANDVINDTLAHRYILPNTMSGDVCSKIVDNFPVDESSNLPGSYSDLFKRIDDMNKESKEKNNQRKKKKRKEIRTKSGRIIREGKGAVKEDFRVIADGVMDDLNNRESFYLIPESVSDKARESERMRTMAARYALADRLAGKYQRISFFNKNLYLLLVVLSSVFLMLYLSFPNEILIVLYAFFLIASMLFFRHTVTIKKRKFHFRFLEYRQLAEVLRVYYYWTLLGVEHPVSDVFHEYLREPTKWLRSVLLNWTIDLSGKDDVTGLSDTERVLALRDTWVNGQLGYHTKKKGINDRKIRKWKFGERTLLLASAVASGIIVIINLIFRGHLDRDQIVGIGIASIVLLLSVTVSMTNVFSKAAFTVRSSYIHGGTPEEIDLKAKMFNVAVERLNRTVSIDPKNLSKPAADACKKIYYELGLMSIDECTSWAEAHVLKDIPQPSAPGKPL